MKTTIQLIKKRKADFITFPLFLFLLFLFFLVEKTSAQNTYSLPNKIEAENYSAFKNAQANIMRVPTSDSSGLKIGYNDTGDWYDYKVNVTNTGKYKFNFRIANGSTKNGLLQILSNGSEIGKLTSTPTGNWEKFQTISIETDLNQGQQTIRIQILQSGVDINWVNVLKISTSPNPSIINLPNKIEAENYSTFKNSEADLMRVPTSDGSGLKIGYNDAGDWYDYKVNVTSTEKYKFNFRIANGLTKNGLLQIFSNGTEIGKFTSAPTGGWEVFQTSSIEVDLNQGQQTIRIQILQSGVDINWIDITKSDSNTNSPLSAAFIVKDMGPGFNLGNVFDLGINSSSFSSSKTIIDSYVNEGMRHIRIPTTWMSNVNGNSLADQNGNIDTNHPRFKELVKTIDYALSLDLYVVLNTHHEHWLKNHYDGSSSFNNRFSNLWNNIANYFKKYSDKLIFEVLNEPEGTMGQWDGPGGSPDPTNQQQLAYTRQIMNVGYNAIRATEGKNETRLIMISTNGQGNHNLIDEVYPDINALPKNGNDNYLAIQVHTYDPWNFCGQDGNNNNYPGKENIINGIITTLNHAKKLNNIPVNYGEFGVGRRTDQNQRNTSIVREFYKVIAATTLNNDMSYTVWDDRGWFGLINNNGSFLHNIIPNILGTSAKLNSNFFIKNELTIYPNPAVNELQINNDKNFNQIEIYNTSGKLVLKKNIKTHLKLDISNLTKGMYFIKLKDDSLKTTIQKTFLKQ